MKQLIFFSTIFLLPALLNAQDYVPMAVDSATWVMGSTDENPIYDEVIVTRIEGDTMVNSIKYKKIYYYKYADFKILNKTRQLIGLLRDDIEERKVYGGIFEEFQSELSTFLNEESTCNWGDSDSFNEHLLYDFSLQEGDSIGACMLSIPTVIISKDSIERFGYKRLNYELSDDEYIMMTEGIGTCIGIFKGQTCFYTGGGYTYGLANYCIGSFENCGLLTSTEEQIQLTNEISITPNPISNVLRISSTNKIKKLVLYDINGRFVMSSLHTEEIEMIAYRSGIYILHVEDNFGNQNSFKVIKQ